MKQALLEGLMQARAGKRPAALLTWLASGAQRLVVEGESAMATLGPPLADAVREGFAQDCSAVVATAGGEVFVHVFNPPLRLIVVGAVHIAQALIPMARQLGYEVTVIDPRRSFATAQRFPEVGLDTDWPDEAMARLAPDARTAVVTLTHDPKLDDPALQVALRSKAFYIGCLGSRRTNQARRQRLQAAGFDEAALSRIHGPIGLDLGGRMPAEIALATLAQMTAVLRRKTQS